MYLVDARQMQKMDQETIESFGIPGRVLMENAGRGAVQILFQQVEGINEKKVAVMAGRGNNGGDGFVMARYLAMHHVETTVFLLSEKDRIHQKDAKANLDLLEPLNIPCIEIPDEKAFEKWKVKSAHQDIWIDAILGTGLKSDVVGFYKEVITYLNLTGKPIFSVDIPSGLHADTGQPCGVCIRARTTVTFAFAKIGHILYPGADYTGRLHIVDIGIPPFVADQVEGPKHYLLNHDRIGSMYRHRSSDAHKGTTGHVLAVAGSTGKTGAAAMTAVSAMRTGAGLVTLAVPETLQPVLETQVLEVMTHPLPEAQKGRAGEAALNTILELLSGKKCLALGPGLGTAEETKNLVCRIIEQSNIPMVVDADGLNNLAGNIEMLKTVTTPLILTPHPGETARLMNVTVSEIQKDRIAYARELAVECGVHVVLKGAKTVIAHPDGTVYVNPTGNPGMASGGMGDVLTGMIAGLIAQGYSPETAARLGVYLHGAAADEAMKRRGAFGYLASDVMELIPQQISRIKQLHPNRNIKSSRSNSVDDFPVYSL